MTSEPEPISLERRAKSEGRRAKNKHQARSSKRRIGSRSRKEKARLPQRGCEPARTERVGNNETMLSAKTIAKFLRLRFVQFTAVDSAFTCERFGFDCFERLRRAKR